MVRLPGNMRDPQTYATIGAAMEVHRTLGAAFLEQVYQEALAVELDARGIPNQRQTKLAVRYKGILLNVTYRADFVCFGDVLVELKAIKRLTTTEESQIINYLSASGVGRGLLLNFGTPTLQFVRFVGSSYRDESSVQSG